MYMTCPNALPANSNPGWVFPKQDHGSEKERMVHVAKIVKGLLDFKDKIEKYEKKKTICGHVFTGS